MAKYEGGVVSDTSNHLAPLAMLGTTYQNHFAQIVVVANGLVDKNDLISNI